MGFPQGDPRGSMPESQVCRVSQHLEPAQGVGKLGHCSGQQLAKGHQIVYASYGICSYILGQISDPLE